MSASAPRAAIVAVGSELLLGGRVERNSLVLARRLAAEGLEVRLKLAVGDDVADIAEAVRVTARGASVLILTGGLGPTSDDCTREAVARATGRPLRPRAAALDLVRRRLAEWGRAMTPAQRRQALMPAGAEVLPNPIGSAPGFLLRWRTTLIAALPGVPWEMERMWDEAVAPRLRATVGRTVRGPRIAQQILHTCGLPEVKVQEAVGRALRNIPGLRLGLLASPLGVDVVLTAVGGKAAAEALDQAVAAVRTAVGSVLYGEGEDTMEQVVGRLLAERGLSLALAESCTGGLVGHRLTEVPGSSAYLDRGLVCYSNRAKTELLGVPEALIRRHGAVSAPAAAAMARGARKRAGVAIGLSVTGIAGPGGATATKPVGLVYVGLDAKVGRRVHRAVKELRFHGEREVIKLRASQAALDLLRLWLGRHARGGS